MPLRDVTWPKRARAPVAPVPLLIFKSPIQANSVRPTSNEYSQGRSNIVHERVAGLRASSLFSPQITPRTPNGLFAGRQIIGGPAPIDGGVYLSLLPCEAVVVEDRQNVMHELFQDLAARAIHEHLSCIESSGIACLRMLAAESLCRLPYRPHLVKAFLAKNHISSDRRVDLLAFVRLGFGELRHQMLLCAWLLEHFVQEGLVRAKVSVEQTLRTPVQERHRLLLVEPGGAINVFDPALAQAHRSLADNRRLAIKRTPC